jgi:sulfite exporter TauE/SafE
MIEWPLVVAGGLLGSAHCVGMCGPIAVALGIREESWSRNLRRQLAFSAGRLFTYGFLGAAAGTSGAWLASRPGTLVNAQALLALAAGAALVVLGLHGTGLVPSVAQAAVRRFASGPSLCSARLIRALLAAPGLGNAALAGVFTGFLPCGLVYSFLALAAATGRLVGGVAAMLLFGAGTIPLMVAAGCGAQRLGLTTRARLMRLAAWCVVATGLISIARGAGFLDLAGNGGPASCPWCL